MDQFDRAQELEAHYLAMAMAQHRQIEPPWHWPAEEVAECIDCGCEIPEKRRRAMPGCKRCIDCQQEYEESR